MNGADRLASLILSTFLLTMAVLILASSPASAQVVGTWSSTPGADGYFDDTWPADYHYDATLVLYGDGTGTFETYCTDVTNVQSGWEGAYGMLGKTTSISISYTESGSNVNLNLAGYPHSVSVSGGQMTGSGTYVDGSGSSNHWTIDLTFGGGGGSGSLGGLPSITGIAIAVAAAGGIFGTMASLVPPPSHTPLPPEPRVRPNPHQFYGTGGTRTYGPSYGPGDERQFAVEAGPIQPGGLPIGGAGISVPIEYVNGVPVRPRQWPKTYGPACPVHGTPCTPRYSSDVDYPGDWFCQQCFNEGRWAPRGFPWGVK